MAFLSGRPGLVCVHSSLALLLFMGPGQALAADSASSLTGSDFELSVWRIDRSSGEVTTALSDIDRQSFFGPARCRCPSSVLADLSLSSTGAAKLASDTSVAVDIMLGNDCSDTSAAAGSCTTVGSLTLSASKLESSSTFSTSTVFTAAAGSSAVDCGALSDGSTTLWAIIRVDSVRIASPPSLALGVTSATPGAPTGVAAETANGALRVSWTAPSSSSTVAGYQVFCFPAPSGSHQAAYEACSQVQDGASMSERFAALDESLLCSDGVSASSRSVRVEGLENGTSYSVAVVSIDAGGTPSLASVLATATPGPTVGFWDLYTQEGGQAGGACAIAGARGRGGSGLPWAVLLGIVGWARRRRGAALPALILMAALLGSSPARADIEVGGGSTAAAPADGTERSDSSPRGWNLELRFGAYRPHIDSEFGGEAHPFQSIYSNSGRLLMGLELDRHISHRGGTLAVALTAGYYRATGRALAVDLVTRTGDESSLQIIPLGVSLVYRADWLSRATKIPLVPYAKVGLDYARWSTRSTGSDSSGRGGTPGWHATGGVTVLLDWLDPESAGTLDRESGINHTGLFFEVSRLDLSGLGLKHRLNLGDTTWCAGLVFEM